jgi:mannan endo-1,4-beta-mannosidase
MKLLYRYLIALLFVPFAAAFAAQTRIDDFNTGTVSPAWKSETNTFKLASQGGYLVVNYNRDGSSGQWDQFHWTGSLAVPEEFRLLMRVHSTVVTSMTVKVVYGDGTDNMMSQSLLDNQQWQDLAFSVSGSSSKVIQSMYFYLDAGTDAAKSGVVRIDYLVMDDTADTSVLSLAIESAELLLANSEEGEFPGQYASGSKVAFAAAIATAKTQLAAPAQTRQSVRSAVDALNDANWVFEKGEVKELRLYGMSINNSHTNRMARLLFYNLKYLAQDSVMFGSQDPTGYGVGWTGDNDRSDIKTVTGAYPSVGAWSVKGVAEGGNFEQERYRLRLFHEQGGFNTMEWHMDNPLGGDFYWKNRVSNANAVAAILPGGEKHAEFMGQLDRVAFFMRNLKDSKGRSIPVIFRPFHEHNGDWFWWGRPNCTEAQYIQLWRMVYDYLLLEKKVTNLLFAFSPDRSRMDLGAGATAYFYGYPGDDYVDVLGCDNYWDVGHTGNTRPLSVKRADFLLSLEILVTEANARGKIAALTETGHDRLPDPLWFTQTILEPIKNHPIARQIAYVAIWRNANEGHHYAPYPGHPAVADFVKFYEDAFTRFIDQMPDLYSTLIDRPYEEHVQTYSAAPQTRPLFRFHRLANDSHFFTAEQGEKDYIVTNFPSTSWHFDGTSHLVVSNPITHTKPVWRMVNERVGSHFFTMERNEVISILEVAGRWFKLDGKAFRVYPQHVAGTMPVYRFSAPQTKSHFFTIDPAERDHLIATVPATKLKYDGVCWYAYPVN